MGPDGGQAYGFKETLADPAEMRRDGVCLTTWTTIRPPVYSANGRLKGGGRFRDGCYLHRTIARGKFVFTGKMERAVPVIHQPEVVCPDGL